MEKWKVTFTPLNVEREFTSKSEVVIFVLQTLYRMWELREERQSFLSGESIRIGWRLWVKSPLHQSGWSPTDVFLSVQDQEEAKAAMFDEIFEVVTYGRFKTITLVRLTQ